MEVVSCSDLKACASYQQVIIEEDKVKFLNFEQNKQPKPTHLCFSFK